MEINDYLERALRLGFEKLTKEELVNLSMILVFEGLHTRGPKPKSKSTFETYAKRELEELKNGRRGKENRTEDSINGLPVE